MAKESRVQENFPEILVGGFKPILEVPLVFQRGGVLSVVTGSNRLYIDDSWTIAKVRAGVGTAPTGSTLIIDVNKNGTTIFTTQSRRPTIADGGNTALNTSTIEVSTLTTGDYLTVDIDQVGSTTSGVDLTVVIWLTRT